MIGLTIQGQETIVNALRRLVAPAPYLRGLHRIGQLVIDEAGRYPAQKRVTRTQAYEDPFQSDKQRRFFFFALRSGRIRVPYRRTGRLRGAWKMFDRGFTVEVVNNNPAALFAHGEEQVRLLTIIGWRKLSAIVDAVESKGVVVAIMEEEIQKELR